MTGDTAPGHVYVTRLLTENRWRLESLAETLLREETLDQEAAYRAAGVEPPISAHGREQRDPDVVVVANPGGPDVLPEPAEARSRDVRE